MLPDHSQSQEVDLERTDQLPIVQGVTFADDVGDDAVRLDFVPVAKSVKSEVRRTAPPGMPSLAESVRSVEERVARRNADYEALNRAFERARTAESAAAARAQTLAGELMRVRALLESERVRSRDMNQILADKNAATEAVRSLRESLAARDAQLSSLQREHAQIVPTLKERSSVATQLETDLNRARAACESLAAELAGARRSVGALTERVKAGEEELNSARRELSAMKAQNDLNLGQADSMRVELALQITALENERVLLKAEALKRDDQMEVLMAHLQEARRAAPPADEDGKRAAVEMEARARTIERLTHDNRSLRAALERTPDPAPDGGAPDQAEWTAELVRIDGDRNMAHPLRRRTRIGRAPGCELVIESSSVSRHHALLHVGTLEVVIEDLNSTNGVLVNGRKVSRQLLRDGDQVTIGEARFRFGVKPGPPLPQTPDPDPR